MSPKFFVGTSGWTYDHWKGRFYPADLPKRLWLDYYSERFSAVEVNATFYRPFPAETYQKWYERVPAGFRYVLKAPQVITHRKFLLDVEGDVRSFWRSAALLKEKLGLVLLQVAPQTPYDPNQLRRAIQAFGESGRVAVEFRHADWLNVEVRSMLADYGTTFVSVDSPGQRMVDWVTSKTGYIRLHGRSRWYTHDYTSDELHEIAEMAQRMGKNGAESVYIFFNNDFEGFAPKNAMALLTILQD